MVSLNVFYWVVEFIIVMENLFYFLLKVGYMEIFVISMFFLVSEISGNIVYIIVDSLELVLLLRKGREEEIGSKKILRKVDEKFFFLEWKSYWERLEEEMREIRMCESEKLMLKNKVLMREENCILE